MSVPVFFNDKSLPAASYQEGCRLLFDMAGELATLLDLLDRMDEESETPPTRRPVADEGDAGIGSDDKDDEEDDDDDDDFDQPAGCEWIAESAFEYYMLTDVDLVVRALEDEEHQYGEYRDEFVFLSRVSNVSPILDNVQEPWNALLKDADVYSENEKQEGWVAATAAAIEGGVLASLSTRTPWDRGVIPLEIVWLEGDDLAEPAHFHALNISRSGHAEAAFAEISAKLGDLKLGNWNKILPGVKIHQRLLRWLQSLSAKEPNLLRRILGHMSRAHRRSYRVDGTLVKTITTNGVPGLLEIRIRHFQSAIRMFIAFDPETKTPLYLFGGVKAQRQTGWYRRAKGTCQDRFRAYLQDPKICTTP